MPAAADSAMHAAKRGDGGPALFIPVAERCGLINRRGGWVIDRACLQRRDWQRQGLRRCG